MPEMDDLLAPADAPTPDNDYRFDRSIGAEFATAFITILTTVVALFLFLAVVKEPIEDRQEPLDDPEPDAVVITGPAWRVGPWSADHRGAVRLALARPSTLDDMASDIHLCEGCGDRLQPSDEVRAVYRELADATRGDEVARPRWAYTHLGHEPQGMAFRIIGRGLLSDLERERQNQGA